MNKVFLDKWPRMDYYIYCVFNILIMSRYLSRIEGSPPKRNVAGSIPVRDATKAEPKRYNVDLASNDEGLRDFRKPFFVLDSQRYMLLFCRI